MAGQTGHAYVGPGDRTEPGDGAGRGDGADPAGRTDPGDRAEPAEQADSRRSELIEAARERWIAALTDLGGRNTLLYHNDRRAGTLDLAAADPEALEKFCRTGSSRLTTGPQQPPGLRAVIEPIRGPGQCHGCGNHDKRMSSLPQP